MLQLDLIGLFITILLLGPQNFVYTIFAITIHEIGRIAVLAILSPPVDVMVTGGILSSTSFMTSQPTISYILVTFSGPIFCLLIGLLNNEKLMEGLTSPLQLINPFIIPKNRWAIINIRLAILSTIIGTISLANYLY